MRYFTQHTCLRRNHLSHCRRCSNHSHSISHVNGTRAIATEIGDASASLRDSYLSFPIEETHTQWMAVPGRELRWCVQKESELPRVHQARLAHLRRVLQNGWRHVQRGTQLQHQQQTSRSPVHVACTLVMTPPDNEYAKSMDEGGGSSPDARVAVTGVNHAFHKAANAPFTPLKGILRGCAEQNALGIVAASGIPYAWVSQVYLLSSASLSARCEHSAHDEAGGTVHLPCPECWRNLSTVASYHAHDRHSRVELFVVVSSQASQSFRASDDVVRTALDNLSDAPIDVTLVESSCSDGDGI